MKSSNKKELSTNVKYTTSIIAAISALEIILARFIDITKYHFENDIILISRFKHYYNIHTCLPQEIFQLDCRPFFIALSIILCLIAYQAIKRYKQSKTAADIQINYINMVSWNMIAAATIGHTYQMLIYGYAVDYISICIGNLGDYAFDIPDLQILAGIILISI